MRLTRENFQRAISEVRKNDDDYAPIPFSFGIPNAKEALIAGLEEVMRHKVEWLAEYDQIVNWLTDNQGKGLLLIGPPGVGKSEIVDGIEKHGTLLIAATNLTMEEIKAKYELRTFDRLRANMQVVVIREKSLRGKYAKCF